MLLSITQLFVFYFQDGGDSGDMEESGEELGLFLCLTWELRKICFLKRGFASVWTLIKFDGSSFWNIVLIEQNYITFGSTRKFLFSFSVFAVQFLIVWQEQEVASQKVKK